jgi:hypothetical protein
VTTAEAQPVAQRVPRPDVDPVAAGRAGGIASREARRLRERYGYVDSLKVAVIEGRGQGAYAAYRTWVVDLEGREQRCRALEAELDDAGETLARLHAEAEAERARIANLRSEGDLELERLRRRGGELEAQLRGELEKLAHLRDQLRAELEEEAAAAGWRVDDDDEAGAGTGAPGKTTPGYGSHVGSAPDIAQENPRENPPENRGGDAAS